MPVFTRRSTFPVPRAELFAWHTRPGAFERLAPPWAPPEVLAREGDLRAGTVTLRMRRGGVPLRWVARHRDYVEGEQFVDEQVEGPFRRWVHVHRFGGDDRESWLEDEVTWEAPLGGLGAWVGGVEATLERTFRFRHRRLAQDLARHAGGPTAPRTVAVSGATGLVGAQLVHFLRSGGHRVLPLVRRTARPGEIAWDPAAGTVDLAALEGVDAVVHLAGETVSQRWTAEAKARILKSRTDGTRTIAAAVARLASRPALISASAVGFYGDRDAPVDEDAAVGEGFLAEVCRAWEEAAAPAREAGLPVAHLRIGVVLTPLGGALAELLPPFRMGAGGPVGSGRQGFPWVALDDVIGAAHFAFTRRLEGPFNVVAPSATDNATFSRTLGAVLHRPAVVPLPAFAVRGVFGEMGQRVLLEGAIVRPTRLTAAGYPFAFSELDDLLRFELGA